MVGCSQLSVASSESSEVGALNAAAVGAAAAAVAVGAAAAVVVAVAGVVRDAALVVAPVGGRGLLGLTENVVEFGL